MINVETLELSKENIQPLKQGRKAGQLGLALQAQTNSEIQQQILKERYNYELLIRMYEGDDPLQPRYDYVAWIEQTFPKHGPETNLIPLLEDTIATYKDDPRYTNDERFIKLIIKYIETQLNRLEIYQLVYGQGIGTKCAYFYKAWAEELDLEQDYKRANNVFQLGLANGAQPKELLEQAQMLFQLSVGRKMLSGVPTAPSRRINNGLLEETSERCVLGKLKKNVGSVRPAQGPAGTLAQSRTLQPPKSNASQPVYQVDALVCVPRVGEPSSTTPFQKSEATHKENMMKAGTWNKGYNKKHHHTPHVTVPHTPSTPSFRSEYTYYVPIL
ncbi:hypothetical protein AAG570_001128 [Ranatra chinensis]|uniref:BUB1 N-terminal domain-containing protein n=1 Tax=Ranatra chinensis TaxID=642074 RepID=A0ABD0YB89_9HEMI